MQIAILFDELASTHEPVVTSTAINAVLSSGLLQGSRRLITVRWGTVLLGHVRDPAYAVEKLFVQDVRAMGDRRSLVDACMQSKVFSWVVSNVDGETAEMLHEHLLREPSYLNTVMVDLTSPYHLGFFRRLMGLKLRIHGWTCGVFHRAFDPEDRNTELFESLAPIGFEEVVWEDLGLRESIFDNFDTDDHFRRLAALRRHLTTALPGKNEDADELLLLFEDLNPQLAATLGTAAETYARASTVEDFAACGVSLRRYLEQLADALFPPRKEPHQGHPVTRDKVKNRLLAFLDLQLSSGAETAEYDLAEFGRRISSVVSEASDAVHGNPTRMRIPHNCGFAGSGPAGGDPSPNFPACHASC
jgi:hypothetical protein